MMEFEPGAASGFIEKGKRRPERRNHTHGEVIKV
jgi:hypothetical protein